MFLSRCISRERSEDTLQRLLEKVNRVPLHEDFHFRVTNGQRAEVKRACTAKEYPAFCVRFAIKKSFALQVYHSNNYKLLWMILKRTKAPQILSGDIVAMTFIGKLVSVFVTIYTIFVVAIVTGVVVNYYGQIVEMQRRETAMMFLDKLERLPELSKEDLEDISKRVQKFR